VRAEPFQVWRLTVKDSRATLACEDGNDRVVFTKAIPSPTSRSRALQCAAPQLDACGDGVRRDGALGAKGPLTDGRPSCAGYVSERRGGISRVFFGALHPQK
jgi:hypothetical protein